MNTAKLFFNMMTYLRKNNYRLNTVGLLIMYYVYVENVHESVKVYTHLINTIAPTVTRDIKILEEYGFVKRKPNKTDRRLIIVTPTEAGSLFMKELLKD